MPNDQSVLGCRVDLPTCLYPSGIDSFLNPLGADFQSKPDHAKLHSKVNDAVMALEQTVGVGATLESRFVSLDGETTDIINGAFNLTTTGTIFPGLIDLGTNTIDDGVMTGNWDFGSGNLTTTGTLKGSELLTDVWKGANGDSLASYVSGSNLINWSQTFDLGGMDLNNVQNILMVNTEDGTGASWFAGDLGGFNSLTINQGFGHLNLIGNNILAKFGLAGDATIGFDGNSLNIIANAGASTDTLQITSGGVFSNNTIKVTDTTNVNGYLLQFDKRNYNLSTASATQIGQNVTVRASVGGARSIKGLQMDVRYTGSENQTGSFEGTYNQIYHTGAGNTVSNIGNRSSFTLATNANASTYAGFQSQGAIGNTKTGTLTIYRGLYDVGMDAEDGTVIIAYGLYSSAHRVDAGSLRDAYGIYLQKQTVGTSINTGIRLAGDGIGSDISFGVTPSDLKIYSDGTRGLLSIATGLDILNSISSRAQSTRWFTKDGDGTDDNILRIFGVGTQADQTNSESLDISFFQDSDTFEITTQKIGTGTLRDLFIYTGANSQIGVMADGTLRLGNAAGATYMSISPGGDTHWVGAGTGLPYGEIYVQDNVSATVITSSGKNNKVQIVVFDMNNLSNNMTLDHTNDHITIVKAGVYKADISITVSGAGGDTDKFGFGLYKNNGTVEFPNVHGHRNMSGGAGDVGKLHMGGLIDVAVDDTIEVWVWNEDDTDNLTIDDITLTLSMKGGT